MEKIKHKYLLEDVLKFMKSAGVSEARILTLGFDDEAHETILNFVELIAENLDEL